MKFQTVSNRTHRFLTGHRVASSSVTQTNGNFQSTQLRLSRNKSATCFSSYKAINAVNNHKKKNAVYWKVRISYLLHKQLKYVSFPLLLMLVTVLATFLQNQHISCITHFRILSYPTLLPTYLPHTTLHYPTTYLPTHLPTYYYLSIYPPIHLSIYLFYLAYILFYLSTCLYIHLYVHLSKHPSSNSSVPLICL